MPNYNKTLLTMTTVPYLELTDSMQNISLALMTSADDYEDSDLSNIIETGPYNLVTILGKNSAIKVQRKIWLTCSVVDIINNKGEIQVRWLGQKSDGGSGGVADTYYDDGAFKGLALLPDAETPLLSIGINSYTITESLTFYGVYSSTSEEFTMYFYKSTAEKNRMDKTSYLELIVQSTGTLRRATSIITPEFEFVYSKVPDFNYVYIPNFGRYYFIDNIVSYRNGVWTLSLSVDVLMSFKEQILQCEAFIDRNEFDYNEMIVDNQLPLQQGQNVTVEFITNELFNETHRVDYVVQGLNLSAAVPSASDETSDQALNDGSNVQILNDGEVISDVN